MIGEFLCTKHLNSPYLAWASPWPWEKGREGIHFLVERVRKPLFSGVGRGLQVVSWAASHPAAPGTGGPERASLPAPPRATASSNGKGSGSPNQGSREILLREPGLNKLSRCSQPFCADLMQLQISQQTFRINVSMGQKEVG